MDKLAQKTWYTSGTRRPLLSRDDTDIVHSLLKATSIHLALEGEERKGRQTLIITLVTWRIRRSQFLRISQGELFVSAQESRNTTNINHSGLIVGTRRDESLYTYEYQATDPTEMQSRCLEC